MSSRLLLFAAFLSTLLAAAIVATGGFSTSLYGLRLSAHSPRASAVVAFAAALTWFVVAWRAGRVGADLAAADAWIERRAPLVIAAIAGLAGAVAVRYSTFSASGADPSGYLSEAAMFASRSLVHVEPLAALANWRDAATTLAPLGWRAAQGGTQVPTYAAGLPLLMLIPHALAGAIGASLVVCASAVVAVWCAGRITLHLASGAAGILAALCVASMPITLFESIQPMSDVPVTAAWLVCWWLLATAEKGSGPVMAGIAAAVAVLLRPNLAPLAAVPALYLVTQKVRPSQLVAFVAPVAVAGALIALLQWWWFGSPLRSGYGTASEIYALANVAPNVALYWQWLIETHGPLLLAAPLALLVIRRPMLWWMLFFAALVCAAYFVYSVFEAWPYLRFLLPAMAIAAIAVAALVDGVAKRLVPTLRMPLLVTLMLAQATFQIATARDLHVFRLPARQARAVWAGRYLASALKPTAVLVSGEQSGALRYYTGRSIVRWDFADAATLADARTRLSALGRDVWIVLDDWEVALFREKFPDLVLDWPPALDAGIEGRTQAWRLTDRARFITGGHVITDTLR